eukprot:COSAG01_NODE_429_length_17183_cov_22.990869_9_plen_84_part_00
MTCDDRPVPKGADKARLEVLLGARSQPRQVGVVQQGQAPKCLLLGAELGARSDREGVLTYMLTLVPRPSTLVRLIEFSEHSDI